ncbi:MAG: hypothetical protein JOZ52_05715 [Acidobacteria bacterium]|nr:hypothetical protein [Acidobacteriota bacterium]
MESINMDNIKAVPCPECKGKGKVKCEHCDGGGKVAEQSVSRRPIWQNCPICDGKGDKDCQPCNSSGYIHP